GYLGGKFDLITQRFVDAWQSFPDLIILIVVVSVVGPGMPQIIVTLGLLLGIIVLFTTRVGVVILAESGLSFLGLGVPPPAPTWGGMLSGSGRTFMFQGPWLALAPGLCLTIVVYATNMFGDALRDLFDPRMRGSR